MRHQRIRREGVSLSLPRRRAGAGLRRPGSRHVARIASRENLVSCPPAGHHLSHQGFGGSGQLPEWGSSCGDSMQPAAKAHEHAGACQCSGVLAMPWNPRSDRLATSTLSSTSPSPASLMSSCSWQEPGQHRRPTAGLPRWSRRPGPGRCWRSAGVVQDLLVGPAAGSLHPGRQPIHDGRLAGCGHLGKPGAGRRGW
jgi:hypothetical protein